MDSLHSPAKLRGLLGLGLDGAGVEGPGGVCEVSSCICQFAREMSSIHRTRTSVRILLSIQGEILRNLNERVEESSCILLPTSSLYLHQLILLSLIRQILP